MITTISSSRGSRSDSSDSRADRILPGIQVGCMMYGVWGMYRGRMGRMVHLGFYRGARMAAGGARQKHFGSSSGGGETDSVYCPQRAHSRDQAQYGQI